MNPRALILLSRDLRLSDHAPLQYAVKQGYDPILTYIHDETFPWTEGGASRWWLHYSLAELSSRLLDKGSRLVLRHGPFLQQVQDLISESKASLVLWHGRVDPALRSRDKKLAAELKQKGVQGVCFWDNYLHVPGSILNMQGEPYQVFTPFYKALLKLDPPKIPIAEPSSLALVPKTVSSQGLDELRLLDGRNWADLFSTLWQPGALSAKKRLQSFSAESVFEYGSHRDFPALDATSRLSASIHFGEISCRQIWHSVLKHKKTGAEPFLRQLVWREFASHMLYFFPHTDTKPLRAEFNDFPWEHSSHNFKLWQKGMTGYPIVDAGMRQLWRLGWMHNRLRMIVGSFLVKDLFIPWQDGARWFWDTLVDADLANNSFGWQWVAGCGADAAPYFRVFNPIIQGEKFDPEGEYVREFVPELSALPNKWIHKPFLAPADVLSDAGIVLGKTYPQPIVDHDIARKKAVETFYTLTKK